MFTGLSHVLVIAGLSLHCSVLNQWTCVNLSTENLAPMCLVWKSLTNAWILTQWTELSLLLIFILLNN